MNVLISIIIPVYNVEKYIHKCIQSILSQESSCYEIILVDDGSPDGCGAICDEYAAAYPEKVIVMHQENQGLSAARNAGLELSSGEYILFVDSDDYLAEESLQTLVDALKLYEFPDMVVFDSRSVDEEGKTVFLRIPSALPGYSAPKNKVFSVFDEKEAILEHHAAWSRVTRKEIFTKNNILFPVGLWYEDIGSTPILLTSSKRVVFIEDVLYMYLHRQGSIMSSVNIERMCNDMLDEFTILIDRFKADGLFDEFYEQIEYFTVHQLLLMQATKIMRHKGYRVYLNKMVDFIRRNFGKFTHNRYLAGRKKSERLKIYLISVKRFEILSLILKIKDKFLKN